MYWEDDVGINISEQLFRKCVSKNAISFVLENESIFNYAGYKVIKGQEELQFINPGKLLQNGKVKLIYNISKYKPLSSLLEDMDSEKYVHIICDIYNSIKELSLNGFIRIENTIINNEEVFVNVKESSVHLICLPLIEPVIYLNIEEFHKNFKSNIMETTERYTHLKSPFIEELIKNLNGDTLKNINFTVRSKKHNEIAEEVFNENSHEPEKKKVSLLEKIFNKNKKTYLKEEIKEVNNIKLESLDLDRQIIFNIDKDSYTIGKHENLVDGLIMDDNTISRLHCRITKEKKQYYITDLGSLNGTYVNNRKINENNIVSINKGDIIKISRINFIVK